MDLLVFIPDYDWIANHVPNNLKDKIGENRTQFKQILLSYVQGKRNQNLRSRIISKNYDNISSKFEAIKELKNNNRLYLALINKDKNTIDLDLPITLEPRIGFMAYDCKKEICNGYDLNHRHLGNKVVKINYK